jgi:hypothetical protein
MLLLLSFIICVFAAIIVQPLDTLVFLRLLVLLLRHGCSVDVRDGGLGSAAGGGVGCGCGNFGQLVGFGVEVWDWGLGFGYCLVEMDMKLSYAGVKFRSFWVKFGVSLHFAENHVYFHSAVHCSCPMYA